MKFGVAKEARMAASPLKFYSPLLNINFYVSIFNQTNWIAFLCRRFARICCWAHEQEGVPIGLFEDGDDIRTDAKKRRKDVEVLHEEMEQRRKKWTTPIV